MGVSCAYRQGRRVEKGGDVEVDVFLLLFRSMELDDFDCGQCFICGLPVY